MAKDLSDTATDDFDDAFEDISPDADGYEGGVFMGGRDNSIRRKIEERMERKRLMEDLGMDADFDF
ncbi:PA3496 family putative envelope integrity protein [Litorivivens sp.]|uniref:PA3496 family putative envelope integrity protein n=1 Tax=Litorivivens sp. TaxID=2020868 RepID=UPI003566083F